MIATVLEHQRKSLAAEDAAGPALEVGLHQSIALCTWCRTTEHGTFRGTAMVLVEKELLNWLARPDGAEIKHVTVLMPTCDGWQPKNLTRLWHLASSPENGSVIVGQGIDGESFTLWPYEIVPSVSAQPTWKGQETESAAL